MTWYGGKEAGARAKSGRSGARRRARVKAAASPEVRLTLDELYARDNGLCYLCKLPVARPQASIEHVVALSNGGADDETNQRLAHRRCNSKKGARTAPRRKGLRRKLWKPKRKPKHEIPDGVF